MNKGQVSLFLLSGIRRQRGIGSPMISSAIESELSGQKVLAHRSTAITQLHACAQKK